MNAKAGDKVRVTTTSEVFEGTFLPRPDLLSDDITVLKLTTGYNIGIETKKIKKIDVLAAATTPIEKPAKAKHNPSLPTIAILSTGGTISSKVDYKTGGVRADYTADDFAAMLPELASIANLKTKKIMSMMSEDALPEDWKAIASAITEVINEVDGVVITHGTDTMHYTSAALSFLLKDLNKPVILTGAQRSIDRGSSDAYLNLLCAVSAAARWNAAEVAICMHASMNDDHCQLLRGTKVRKMHTSRRDAFQPVNSTPLARISSDGKIEELEKPIRTRNDGKPTVRDMSPDVALIYSHPNLDPEQIELALKQKKKAMLIAATGLGCLPLHNKQSILPALKKAAAKMPIFICNQTIYGNVHGFVYSNMRELSLGIHAHYLEDMHLETAFAKLCVALGQKDPVQFMLQNIAGETNDRILDDYFP